MDPHRLMVERRPKLTGIREGMFGRMFPDLPPLQVAPEEVLAIGAEQGHMDVAAAGAGIINGSSFMIIYLCWWERG